MRTLLTNATVIDCVTPDPVPGCSVLLEDGRIVEVVRGAEPSAATDLERIDLEGAYLLPGLWDVHAHADYIPPGTMPLPEQVTLFGSRLRDAMLESGVIGLRCAGVHDFMDVAWKRAFDSGQHLGPRIFAAGSFLTTTGGHFLGSGHALELDGPYGWVSAIRTQIKNGVDHIKLNLSGGIMGPPWDLHHHTFPLAEELEAAFDICSRRGFRVMAHATNPEAVKSAIQLGAHSVEHGYIMDDECVALFLERDTWYVPTLCISNLTPRQASNQWEADWVERSTLTEALADRADAAAEEHRAAFLSALRAGVKMAAGSDIRPLTDGVLLELGLWVRAGATPWEALVAATRNGAAICGVGDELGTIEEGKIADLIVVDRNPLEDINNLRRLQLVLKDGRIVSDKRTPQA